MSSFPIRGSAPAVAAALVLAHAGGLSAQTPAAPEPLVVKGDLGKSTRWSGVVRIVGDVVVPAGGRLEIAAGTKVLVADQDALQSGWDKKGVEFHVRGQLLVMGSTEQPVQITLESQAADLAKETTTGYSRESRWHGITLFHSSDATQNRDHVRGLQLEYAMSGIQVPNGDPLIEDCVFRNCAVGVEVGTLWAEPELVSSEGCGPAGPEILRCRFTGCGTGVSVADRAVPAVQMCVFHKVQGGVSTVVGGLGMSLEEPGPSVQHCLFSDCGVGVNGCSLVRDSLFVGGRRALSLSRHHYQHGTEIEHMVSESCLVHGSEEEIHGDTAVARDVIRGDPMLRGPLSDLEKAWPPLPPCLELQAGSAAIGAARDGSDVGPIVGQRQRLGPKLPWTGKVLTGLRAASCEAPGGWQKSAKPTIGATFGKSWWVAADQGGDGLVAIRRVFGFARTTGLLAFEFDCAAAGTLPLEFSADCSKLEIAVNGTSVVTSAQRRRFGSVSAPVQVKVKAGTNVLVVHVVAWGPDPLLGLALGGEWTPTPVAAAAAATAAPSARGSGLRNKDGQFVEATLSVPCHWTSAPGQDLARVKPVGRLVDAVVVEVNWTGPGKMRIGPLPEDCSKGEIEVSLPGLRDPNGAPLAVPSFTVKL